MPKPKTGSIRKRAPGVWELCVTQKSPDGQQKRRYETFRGNKADAEAHLRAMQVADDRGQLPTTNITLSAWMDHWMRTYAAQKRPGTVRAYGWVVEHHIKPNIGHLKLDKVTVTDLRAFVVDLRKRLSPKSVELVTRVLSVAYGWAVDEGKVSVSPVRRLAAVNPKEDTEIIPPTKAQVDGFMALAWDREPNHAALFHLVTHCGLRISEVLGLTWADVKFDDRRLYVRQQLNEAGGLHLGPVKTKKSQRAIPIRGETPAILLAHAQRQLTLRDAETSDRRKFDDLGLVFGREDDGGLVWPQVVRRAAHKLWTALGDEDFRVHDMRHYFGSEALRRGVPLATVSKLLGHSSVKVTSDIYIHHNDEDFDLAMDKFEAGEQPNSGLNSGDALEKLLAGVELAETH